MENSGHVGGGSGPWAEVSRRDGVTVWKRYFPPSERGHQYPCVKARGEVDAPPEKVLAMLTDSARVKEYNSYSVGRTDVAKLGPDTKIVWNRAQPPLSTKLHDFCTLMHIRPLRDSDAGVLVGAGAENGKAGTGGSFVGGYVMLTRATEHPRAPILKNHVRSEILLGITVLRPAPGSNGRRTDVTTVTHVVSNGVPVMIADRVSARNAADFIINVGRSVSASSAATARR
ncbi:unnamed protein product [Phaeothamnion confervicola]